MKKNEKIGFFVFLFLLSIIALYDYNKEVKGRSAVTSDIALCGYVDIVDSYNELNICNSMTREEIEAYDAEIVNKLGTDSTFSKRFLTLGECCYAYNNSIPLSYDIYMVFFAIMKGPILYYAPFIIPFLVLFFSLRNINRKFKSKYAHYYIQRKSYKSFVIRSIIEAYKYALGIPFMYILIFLLTLTITNHYPIEMSLGLKGTSDYLSYVSVNGFWIYFGIIGLLFSLIIINIGLIFLRNNGKFIFIIIESYIAYFVLAYYDEWYQFNRLLNFNRASEEVSVISTLIFLLVYFTITFILVIALYRNKEKTLLKLGGK